MNRSLLIALALMLGGASPSSAVAAHQKKKPPAVSKKKNRPPPVPSETHSDRPELSAEPPKVSPTLPAAEAAAPALPETSAMDFDLFGDSATFNAAEAHLDGEFEAAVQRRRIMLKVHQAVGIATWASLVATSVVGQLNFNDKYRGGGDTGRYQDLHLSLSLSSTALFTGVGLLGVLAPVPFEKKPGFSTATLHKIMMGIATAGMATQVGLGLYTQARNGKLDQRAYAQAHQIIGYTTLGAMTIGGVAFFF